MPRVPNSVLFTGPQLRRWLGTAISACRSIGDAHWLVRGGTEPHRKDGPLDTHPLLPYSISALGVVGTVKPE